MAFLGKVDFMTLSETERVIYRYLSDNYEKIPILHIRDIAQESHAGTSSVMRLIKKLGYTSYPVFQAFIQEKQRETFLNMDYFDLLSTKGYPKELVEKYQDLVFEILRSKIIVFLGLGSSGSICDYAARRFATLGLNALSITDPTYPVESRLSETKRNLIIAISISGGTSEIFEILQRLKPNAEDCIASITPSQTSDIGKISHISINYEIEERRVNLHGDLTSQIPSLFIIETLSEMIYEKMMTP